MTKFTILIYRFFKRHQIIFYLILLASTALFARLSLKINFEEDISKLLPSTQEGGAEELVFSNLKVKDKIFILFHPLSDEMDPDALTEICDEFVEALFEKDTVSEAIHHILYQVDESLFQDAISYLYDHVPVFLDSSRYRQLDEYLTPEHIDVRMEENYKLLRSSAGSAYKGLVTHDPIAMRNMFLGEMQSEGSGLGGNYTLYNGHLFTADTTVALAFLSPNFKSFDSKQGIRLAEMIEEEIARFQEEHPELEILYHGAPVQSVYNSRQIKKDLLVTISISLLLVFIILLVCFKNKSTLLYLVLPVGYGVLFALAVVYLIKGSMSLMAMGIGAIVMGVAFSYCMHVITHYKYVSDPERVLRDQTVPVFMGALTTIGAFMGLLLTKSELLQDFGLFASLGLVGTTVFCLLFLPQFFRPARNRKSDKAFAILEKINSFPLEKQKWLIALILIVSAICFFKSGDVKFDSDLRNIGYDEPRVVRSRELLAEKTTANFATVYFASVSENLDSALIYNRALSQRLDQLVQNGDIHGYSAPAALFVPEAEQRQRIEWWEAYWTPEKVEAVEQDVIRAGERYKFASRTFTPFFNMIQAEFEPVSLYDAGVIPEELLDNIIEYTDNRYLVFTPVQMDRARLMEVGDEIVTGHPEFVVIDPMYYTSDMVKVIHNDFDITLTISSLFVLLVLLLSYKNLILALLAFLPMGLSWYIVLGMMSITGMEFNLINIVISTFIFGIGVDYSIFIMDGLRGSYRTREPLLMYHKTAIFLSAVILIIVITSLLFAVHPAIASIGVATLIGMGATILIAYSLQPFLFNLLITQRTEKGKAPISLIPLYTRNKLRLSLKNNYVYKGFALTWALGKAMRATDTFALIRKYAANVDTILDYGCEAGFCSYAALLAAPGAKITGYEADPDLRALAANCYQKTANMQFTDDPEVLQNNFELIILQSAYTLEDEMRLKKCCSGIHTVIVNRKVLAAFEYPLHNISFHPTDEDALFVVFSYQNEEA